MSQFFKQLLHNPVAIDIEKMWEVSKIINARDLACDVSIFTFIKDFSNRIDDFKNCLQDYKEASESLKDEYIKTVEVTQLGLSVCISILAKYFYPIIEQLERLVDDGIKTADSDENG